jgi:hypothetical protein
MWYHTRHFIWCREWVSTIQYIIDMLMFVLLLLLLSSYNHRNVMRSCVVVESCYIYSMWWIIVSSCRNPRICRFGFMWRNVTMRMDKATTRLKHCKRVLRNPRHILRVLPSVFLLRHIYIFEFSLIYIYIYSFLYMISVEVRMLWLLLYLCKKWDNGVSLIEKASACAHEFRCIDRSSY